MPLHLKSSLLSSAGLVSAAMLAASAFSNTAIAQSQSSEDSTASDAAQQGASKAEIIVTGTRISQPNLRSANPITVITGSQLVERGGVSIGDKLNQLPQLRNTYNSQNSTRFLGTRGLNLLDLRGLGTQRTLVLVNGRRHVGSDILTNGVSTDINTIPSDLIKDVQVLTGGASGVYGSDAVAGVVNFILDDHFEGIRARGKVGVSKYDDAGTQYASILAGKNFADGRGNVALDLEFSHQARYFASKRPGLASNQGFVITDTDPAGTPNGSDSVFDRTFYNDIRSATISPGGLIAVFQPAATAPCGTNVSAFTCTFLFQPDGSLVSQSGTRIGIGPNGNFNGGNGETNRDGQLLVLSPDVKRYSANLLAHFEFSPAATAFLEAKYVRTEAFGSASQAFFSTGTTLGDPGGRERVRLDNPYLSTQARTLLTQQFLATTVNPNTGAALSAGALASQQAAINAGSFRFNLKRRWNDFGVRDEKINRETFRIVAGLKGDFNDDWKYEISVNYGQHKEKNTILGNVNVQRYLLALDTTRDANNNIVCSSKLSPAATVSYVTGDTTSDPRLAGDISACVPLNPFGSGSVTQAARDYILVDSHAEGKITQLDVMGYVAGDTSKFFNLPGGPVAFSIGGEYRRETNSYVLDDVTQQGYAFYNAIPSLVAPAFKVLEGYVELKLPILKDVPFAEELSLHGSGRIAHYFNATGTVYSYGGEAIWKPVRDLTFRGSYSRSVRAPNLIELYSAQGQNFAPGFVDPCSARNIGTGSTNRAANCTAAGAPAGYDFVYLQSLETKSGGNPDLKAEHSNSWTIGGILEPRWAPGLSLSVDYWNIKVPNVIASVSAQDVADLCYDLPSLNNQFCDLFERAGAGGGPNGEVPFQILEASLLESSANFAKLQVRGIDTQLAYQHTFDWGRLDLGIKWTHVIQNDSYTNPTDPTYADRYNDELNDPTDRINLDVAFKHGKVTFEYAMRWLDAMYLNTYEDYNSLNGEPPQNADYAPIKKYPRVSYHDFKIGYDVTDNLNLYLGVDNAFNKMPPYGLTGTGGGSGIYDNRGRFLYGGFKTNF